MVGNTGTPSGSAASTATRSERMRSTPRLSWACCSVLPIGTTARSSALRYASTCIQFGSVIFMARFSRLRDASLTHQLHVGLEARLVPGGHRPWRCPAQPIIDVDEAGEQPLRFEPLHDVADRRAVKGDQLDEPSLVDAWWRAHDDEGGVLHGGKTESFGFIH